MTIPKYYSISIGQIAEPAHQVAPDTPAGDLQALFQGNAPVAAIVVTDHDRVMGLVMDIHLDRCLSQRYGFAFYHKRPVTFLMDKSPLIADHQETVEDVAENAMARDSKRLYDHIIITREDKLLGLVPVKKILNTLADSQKRQARKLAGRNLTLKKEVEDRKKAITDLKASRRMLQLVIDSIPHAIFWKDRHNTYLGCNTTFARDGGFTDPDQIIGLNDDQLPWPLDQVQTFRQDDRQVLDSGRSLLNQPRHLTRSDGSPRSIRTSKIPLFGSNKTVVGLLCFYEDITRQIRNQREKEQLEDRLLHAKKMEAIGRLAGGVAHDLNNILSAIVSYPELMMMDLPAGSKLKKPLVAMKNSGERAVTIVQDLLTLARRAVVSKDSLDLNEMILSYLNAPEATRLKSEFPLIRIRTDLTAQTLPIQGSQTHLMKTLMNLINNSAEAIEALGEIVISTRTESQPMVQTGQPSRFAVLTVADTGRGLSETDREKIFEPFYTRKKMGRSGSGLGMSVVWGTVQDHNGHIKLHSAPGKGTRISIHLPLTRECHPAVVPPCPLNGLMGRGETIAVVDDRQDQREIAGDYLERLNYKVTSLESGEAAVNFFLRNRADMVVLDMIMDPGMDGLETYEQILRLHPGQKALIVSGYSKSDRIHKALSLGAGGYLKKPYHFKELGQAVKEALNQDLAARSA